MQNEKVAGSTKRSRYVALIFPQLPVTNGVWAVDISQILTNFGWMVVLDLR